MNIPIISLAPKAAAIAPRKPCGGRKKATHCRRGHALIESNLYQANGSRQCATCRRDYEAVRSAHGKNRAGQEGRNASGSGQKPRCADHSERHSNRSQKGTPWRQAGQFRSHGKTALQTARG